MRVARAAGKLTCGLPRAMVSSARESGAAGGCGPARSGLVMSYLEYYELEREPFSNAPVSSFYFNSSAHSQALARLSYAVSQSKGLALLTGDAGTGKTTLARRLLDSLPEHLYEASLLVVIHSGITPGWLLRRFSMNLGVQNPAEEKLALIGQLYERLVAIHEEGRRAVILIDEAQMLQTRDIMEEFRGAAEPGAAGAETPDGGPLRPAGDGAAPPPGSPALPAHRHARPAGAAGSGCDRRLHLPPNEARRGHADAVQHRGRGGDPPGHGGNSPAHQHAVRQLPV